MSRLIGALFGVLFTTTFSYQAVAANLYRLQDLQISSQVDGLEMTAISDTGYVVGQTNDPNSSAWNPFIWKNGVTTYLPTTPNVGGRGSLVRDVNNLGQAVGITLPAAGGVTNGLLWDNGTVDTFASNANVWAINDQGQIGGAADFSGAFRPFLYENGVLTNLSAVSGAPPLGTVSDINDQGVALIPGRGLGTVNGTTWTDLSGVFSGSGVSFRGSINDSGQIVGGNQISGSLTVPFLLENGVLTNLGSLGSASSSDQGNAFDINNLGQVVGESNGKAFLWEDGSIFDIASLIDPNDPLFNQLLDFNNFAAGGIFFSEAVGINNSGQILLSGGYFDGTNLFKTAYIASPVPIPTAIWLFGSGLVGLIGFARKKVA